MQREYWTQVGAQLQERRSVVRPQKPPANSWTRFAIGRSHIHLTAFVNNRDKRIGVELVLTGPNAKQYFAQLHEQRAEIEADLGAPLEWKDLSKGARLVLRLTDVDPSIRSDWPRQHEWLVQQLDAFYRAFVNRVKHLGGSPARESSLL